jgi:hypothetical protein
MFVSNSMSQKDAFVVEVLFLNLVLPYFRYCTYKNVIKLASKMGFIT